MSVVTGTRATVSLRSSQPPWEQASPLIVLAITGVLDDPGHAPFDLAVSAARFAEHLSVLERGFRVVDGRSIADTEPDGDPRPRVLITFDDGYRDNVRIAAPLLREHGMRAVLFLTTGPLVEGGGSWWDALAASDAFRRATADEQARLQAGLRLLPAAERRKRLAAMGVDVSHDDGLFASWSELQSVSADGTFEIGAHTRGHASLGCLGAEEISREIRDNVEDIRAHLGHRPRLFAFPHGSPEDVSLEAVEALVREGFEFGFTTTAGRVPLTARRSGGTAPAMILPRSVVGDCDGKTLDGQLRHGLRVRPRKLVVLSGVTANNLGDDAMLIATVRQLRELDPEAETVVLAEDPERCTPVALQLDVPLVRSPQQLVQRFLGSLDDRADPALAILELARSLVAHRSALARGDRADDIPEEFAEGLWHLVSADGVIDCGGANLTGHWKSYFYEKCLDYLVADGPLFVSGQGIDPFDGDSDVTLLRTALGKADGISVREGVTAAYLDRIGCAAPTTLAGDDALTLESAGEERRDALLRTVGVVPGKPYVAFQYRHYLDYEQDETLDRFAKYVDGMVAATGLAVVGVPMHFDRLDERDHLRALRERVENPESFLPITRHLTPSDAKALFAGAKLGFGISYHSAIFALSSGVPYLGLYRGEHYAQKMTGLAELYETPALPVAIDQVDAAEFVKRVREVLDHADTLRARLRHRQLELSGRVSAFRRSFLDAVGGGPAVAEDPRSGSTETPWSNLRRLKPVSRCWGFDRGLPIDRFYIERYLAEHAFLVRGDVCELMNDDYTRRYGRHRVRRAEVLDIDAGNPKATLVDDLTAPAHLGEGVFDCFILTQVLPYLYDCRAAVRSVFRSLKPGGAMLVTVPSIIKVSREPEDHWRFTPDSLARLLRESCPDAAIRLTSFGNVLAATAFLQGMAVADVTPGELIYRDPEFPVIVAATVVK